MLRVRVVNKGVGMADFHMKKKVIVLAVAVLAMLVLFVGIALQPAAAQATTLTVTIKSWDKIGIDANKPATEGPNHSIVQARICNTGLNNTTNVTANFTWTSYNASIYLHPNERTVKNLGTLAPGECTDVFYVVEMKRDKTAKGQQRSYTINVTSDNSTPKNASQTLTVVGLIGQSEDSVVFVNISNNEPQICTTFEVIVWANITRSVNDAGWPLEYDPGVIELINVTVNHTETGEFVYEVFHPGEPHKKHYVTYTFHALAPGTTNINVFIQDVKGAAYHYNNNFETVGIPPIVIKSADIAVNKTVDNSSTHLNETVVFTITVTNHGPDDATGVNVTDGLPTGLTLLSHEQCPCTSYNQLTGVWTIADLANGTSETLKLTAKVTQLGNITNNVTITAANEYDPNTGNNTDNETINSQPAADIKVVKSVDNPHPDVGENITYTILVINNGPNNATGVNVTDGLPTGLSYVSNTTSQGTYNSATAVWSVDNLTVGAFATLNITATVTLPGYITNNVTAAATEYDPDTANNQHNQTINVPAADIALTKSVNNTRPNVGEIVVFNITITNNGPDDASGVEVSDGLPPGLSYVSHEECPCTSYNPLTGNWTVGNLANGTSRFLNIIAVVTQPGSITNFVNRTALNEYDFNATNDHDNQTIYVPAADIEVNKTVNKTEPNVGDPVVFTITVTNNGPDNATGLEVTDLLPSGLVHISNVTLNGTYNNATGIWAIGPLANGSSAILNITVNVTVNASRTNTAELTAADQFDHNSTPNNHDPTEDDQDSVTIRPLTAGLATVDIEVNKTVNNSAPALYQHINYTITVTNNGPDNATGVVVQDLLPPGLIHISNHTTNGTYSYTTGRWDIGPLLNGSSATLNITVNVTIVGNIENTAVKTAVNEEDTNTTNDIDTASILVTAADIEVLKTVNKVNPNVNETINYTITVTNYGPSNATGLEVTDVLPTPQLVHVSNSTANGTYNNGTGIWTIGPLTNGSSATLTITATVTLPGLITNTANKSALIEPDPNPANDNHTQIIYSPYADLEVNKTVDNSSTHINEIVVFTITVTNHGPDDATGVNVTDGLPTGLTLLSHEECKNCTAYDRLTGVWTVGDLANGVSEMLKLTAKVTQLGNITNNATITAANEYDNNTANNRDNATVYSDPAADVKVVKSVDNPNPNVGENITYTILVINNGPSNATGVTVTDGLPPGLEYVSNTTSQGTYNPATAVWSVDNLTVGAVATLNITATVTQPGFITNNVTTTATEYDPNTANNQHNQTIYDPYADIELNKSVDNPTPTVGDLVTYTITLTNKGPDDAVGLTQVIDGLPAGLVFVDHTAPPGSSYDSLRGIWYVSFLENGSSAILNITVRVTPEGGITNTAEVVAAVRFDPDSTPNNHDPAEDDQASNVIIVSPLPVPELTLTGMIALVGLLLITMALCIRMKKRN